MYRQALYIDLERILCSRYFYRRRGFLVALHNKCSPLLNDIYDFSVRCGSGTSIVFKGTPFLFDFLVLHQIRFAYVYTSNHDCRYD